MEKAWHLRVKCATPKTLAAMLRPKIAYSQKATRKSPVSENHAVQNTSERVSHHRPYAAKDYEASETINVYEARSKEASEEKICMKLMKREASETERALGAV